MNLDITIKIFDKIPGDLKTTHQQLKDVVFAEDRQGETQAEKEEHEDRFFSQNDRLAYILAFFNDKQIVGSATILKREIPFEDQTILLGGIGGVWVKSEHRRKGIATMLLKAAMKQLNDNHCDLAYLCTNIVKLEKLYSRFGFVPLGRPHTFTGKSGTKYIDEDGMIAPVTSTDIFHQVLTDSKPFDIGQGNW